MLKVGECPCPCLGPGCVFCIAEGYIPFGLKRLEHAWLSSFPPLKIADLFHEIEFTSNRTPGRAIGWCRNCKGSGGLDVAFLAVLMQDQEYGMAPRDHELQRWLADQERTV